MEPNQTDTPQWKPLNKHQRRVLGTLMEKSKTTPDAYPLTMSVLTTGCNQKTNRAPLSNYNQDQVEKYVDELRAVGAVALVQGSGRVDKVRHYAYQWLGISKSEAAVMTELLLRGEQTVGDLRSRASRMEPIPDQADLATILGGLKDRRLVVELTPAGRGQIVTHNLYEEWEMEQLKQQAMSGALGSDSDESDAPRTVAPAAANASSGGLQQLEAKVAELTESLRDLHKRIAHLEKELGVTSSESD